MNKSEKQQLVTELRDKLVGAKALYYTDFTGLNVKRMTELRRRLRRAGVQYVVDQVDSVLGCLIALRLYYRPSRSEVAMAFVLGSAIHMGLDGLLYALGVKRRNG